MPSSHEPANEVSPADAQLRARIEVELRQAGRIDATKIGVVVHDGQVLLWGSVASERERTRAGELAARITGKPTVTNHVDVYRTTAS